MSISAAVIAVLIGWPLGMAFGYLLLWLLNIDPE